jgi:hypothetical protein
MIYGQSKPSTNQSWWFVLWNFILFELIQKWYNINYSTSFFLNSRF